MEIIGIIFSSVIFSVFLNYVVLKNEGFKYQDEQTEWVNRLVKVSIKTNSTFQETDLLEIIACLRPIPKVENNKNLTNRDLFMNEAIIFCASKYSTRGKLITFSKKDIVKLRLICNMLLKEHWEYLEEKNKFWFTKVLENKVSSIKWITTQNSIEHKKKKEELNEMYKEATNIIKNY